MSGKSALVIGAGIAGASLAYFLSKAGVQVTVIDAAQHTASHVPSALINPVRGQSGQVDADALAGMHFTWALIRELEAQGYAVPHGQTGVLRPVPDDKTRAKFERHLPADLAHEWVTPSAPLRGDWEHVLWLPAAGWVDGAALCRALLAASGAEVVQGRAKNVDGRWLMVDRNSFFSINHHPSTIYFCGGSIGSSWAGERGTHRMGSLLLLDRPVSAVPLSFGAYLSPDARCDGEVGGVLGGTFEVPAPTWQAPKLPLASLDWLLRKGEALADLSGASVTGRWTGSRLSGLQAGQDDTGVWRLSGLSSKGFLLGPLLAWKLAGQVAQT